MSHNSIDSEIDSVHSQLSSSKITQRKEGLKKLNVLLDSGEFLQILDDNTLSTPTTGKIKVGTWPGLCVSIVDYATTEVSASLGKKKGPDAAISKALRRFVQLADDDRRTGRKGLLARKAAKLFVHVKEIIAQTSLASPIGQEYSALLRAHLLPVPQYRNVASTITFQELLDIYMSKLEEQLDRSEDSFRNMSSLLLLLQHFPGDMEPVFQQDVVTFFSNQLPVINQLREDSRISTAFMTAVNSFLLKNGLDVSSRSAELQQALQPFLLRAWRSSRDQKLKDAFVLCLNIQIRLGSIKGTSGAVVEIQGLLDKEVNAASFKWGSEDKHGDVKLPRQADSLLQLTAAVWHLSLSASPGAAGAGPNPPHTKKLKVAPPFQRLHEQAMESPLQWAPVLAMLIHNHRHHISHMIYTDWLQAVHSHSLQDESEPAAILWLLRYLHELALAWPAALTAAEDDSDAAGGISIAQLEACWKAVWDSVLGWLSTTTSKPAVQEQGLALLAVIADRNLASNLQLRSPQLWSLPVLQQSPLTSAGACLICPAFTQGAATSDQEKALQQALLKRVLTDSVPDVPPQLLVQATGALTCTALPRSSKLTVALHGWRQEGEDDGMQQQLEGLVRGEEWMGRSAQQAKEAYQRAAAAKRMATSPSQSMPSEDAGPRQKLAGQLLQQQLQLLTVDSQEADSALLAKLLHTCLITVALVAAFNAAAGGVGADLSAQGMIAEALQLALGRVSSLMVSLSEGGKALPSKDMALLNQLVDGLRFYPYTRHAATLNNALLGCMGQLERIFKDADSVVLSSLASSVQMSAGPGLATQAAQASTAAVGMLFDDDLDLGASVVAAAGAKRPRSAGPGTASLASSCRMSCLALITSVGMLDPIAAIPTILHLLHHIGSAHLKPPPELVQRALQCLCSLVATAEGCCHIRQATAALAGEPDGLLAHKRFQRDEVLLVLQQLSQLARAFLAQHGSSTSAGQWSDAVQEDLDAMVTVLEEVMCLITAAESKDDKCTTWQIRVQLATCILDLVRIDTEGFGDELLSVCLEKVTKLLSDDMYFARREGAGLATVLYTKWTRPQSVFDDLKQQLKLRSLAGGSHAAERMETDVLTLGETAAASGLLERQAVFLMCGHAAQQPSDVGLVGAALDMLAARLSYPARSSLLAFHMRVLLFDWCSHGYSIQQLLAIQELVAVDGRALLTSYMHDLLPVLLLDQREEQLREVATLLGTDEKSLLQKWLSSIIGTALPYTQTGDNEERALANTVTAGGLLLKHLTEEERNKLFHSKVVSVISTMLLTACDEPAAARPFFPIQTVLAAINTVPNQRDAQKNEEVLWSQVLRGDAIGTLLLSCHQQLSRAKHPRHARQALAPLKALLTLLGDSVTVPSTFRYATTILLQQLSSREMWADCCGLLQSILDKMLKQQSSLQVLGAHLQTILASLMASLQCNMDTTPATIPAPLPAPSNTLVSDEGASAKPVVRLVLRLTVEAPQALHPYLRDVEPLLPLPQLDPACRLHQKLRQGLSLAEELQHFAGRAKSMSTAMRQRSLAALAAALPARKHQLFQSAPTGHPAAFLPRVEEATWRLAWFSGETQDSSLAAFAGELLALAGPLDPSAIAFNPACAPQTHQLSNNSNQAAAEQDSSSSRARSLLTMMIAALQLMADYLVDPDVLVIRSVQFTLRNLLATQLGRDAFAQLDAVTQGYLQVYRREGVSSYRPSSKDASDPKWSLHNNPKLWSIQGQSYASWVRNLAYALLLLAKEPTLAMSQHMIVRKAQLAELMLPHILADIAQHDTDSTARTAISTQLSGGLLSPTGASHIKATQLVLTCLDHLRNLHLDAVLGLDPDRPKGVSGAAGSSQGRSRSGRGAPGESSNSPAAWSKQYWLDIDYLQVAAAALQCSAYFTALLYVEHWIEEQCGRLKLDGCSLADKGSQAKADQLLLEVYSSINEPDGIYAVARGHSMLSQLKLYEHEGSWDKALAGYDMLCHRKAAQHGQAASLPSLSSPSSSSSYTAAQDRGGASVTGEQGLLTSLQQLGCRHLIEAYWQSQPGSLSQGNSRSAEMRYESAWRMGQWQSCEELHSAVPGRPVGTNEAVLGCLKALSNGDRERCRSLLFDARQNVIKSLATVSTESVSNVNPAILQLQQLQCLQEAWNFKWTNLSLSSSPTARQAKAASASSEDRLPLMSLQSTWRGREAAIGAGDKYELREPLLALRKAVLEAVGQPQQAAHTLHEAAVAARQTGHLTHAMAAAHQLITTHTPHGGAESKFAWRVEEAKLLWAQGQHAVAVSMSKSLLEGARQNKQHDMLAYARLRSLTGKWLAETRFESSSAILASMGEAADTLVISGMHTGQVACRVMYRLAHHADMLYAGIQAQRQSAEWNTAQAVIKQKRQQVNLLQQQLQLRKQRGEVKKNAAGEIVDRESRVLVYQINNMMRPIQFDEEESSTLQDNEARYLLLALTNYHRCLLAGGRYDLQVVFRLFQLWFTLGSDKGVNDQLAVSFREVPSYKLLSLVYQIASRMSAAKSGPYYESGFQATLQRLLQRLAVEHPHHTLYQLFALKNGNRGKDGRAVQAGDVVGGMAVIVDHDKVAAAQDLISIVGSNPARKAIVEQVNQLIEAYIHLAALPASSDGAPMPFPSSMRRRIHDLNLVPVVSAPVQVDPSCRYDNLPHFSHFGDRISFVGGINKPKLIQCFDSGGHCHRQLVKSGNDDMRQDAVMQQFFALINNVLQESPDTQKRSLRIVTYKVVPFSPASGLLEWVEDTIPVHEYLTGKDKHSGAHQRYKKPADLPFAQCFQAMHKAKRNELRQTFDHVTAHFSPVLHHFFLETFRHPAHWFERRLQYTRSVAVNSMAGYIIGLGDRHSHNILLDRKTAEVVHIDLGVAFEQGRFLNTPELVPFRLTSNIVDGMGATGVEGVMRSCCEKTLGVLRQNKESLIIIIEVFIHDPLYKWALTPLGAQQRQKDDLMAGDSSPADPANAHPTAPGLATGAVSGSDTTLANADAERALLRLKQKLAGMEGGQGEARGVKGQVQQLLQDAQNPDKLCKMYVGWSAWL